LHHVHVGLLEDDFLASALATRLLASLLWPADNRTFAERLESPDKNLTEAAAIGDEQRDRGNPPDNAQHGQEAARSVALESDPRLANDFDQHRGCEEKL